jgi:hypothetical protein
MTEQNIKNAERRSFLNGLFGARWGYNYESDRILIKGVAQ